MSSSCNVHCTKPGGNQLDVLVSDLCACLIHNGLQVYATAKGKMHLCNVSENKF